jgi:hypothetical protein
MAGLFGRQPADCRRDPHRHQVPFSLSRYLLFDEALLESLAGVD